jgi:signal transduction histidine kinase
MNDFFNKLLGPEMPPHGHCYLWNEDLVRLHVFSDAVITASYFTIPIALVYLVRKRDDLKFNYIFVMFAVFIFACGATHLVNIFNVWYGAYWLSGGVKLVTALASLGTAIVIWPLIPKALAIPSNVQLLKLNQQLREESEVNLRQKAEVERLSLGLTQLVDERTKELAETRLMKTLLEKNHDSLERSNKALELYARVTSQDIKEPLRSISVFGQLLSERLGPNLASEETKWLNSMVASSQRMTTMVDDLQEYCAPHPVAQPVAVRLDDIVNKVLAKLSGEIAERGVVLDREELGSVLALPSQMQQLLLHLLENALKFSVAGTATKIHIGPLHDNDSGEQGFFVRDNGIGIARHYQSRIFGVFERLHPEGEYEGSGIGLAICARIVEECGGRIEVISEEGAGAEFRVYLPSA